MNNKRYGWALVALVLVFGGAAIIAYNKNHERAASIPTASNLALYGNDTYGYSYYYPPEFTVRVASEEEGLLGVSEGSQFKTSVVSRVVKGSPERGTYDDFVREAVIALCAAESCSGTPTKKSFKTDANLEGVEFTVSLPDGTAFGPVYTFNIGGNVKDAKFATVLVYRPTDATGQESTLSAKDVASKLEINKVEKR
jgi:hypothetical protein